MKDRHIKSVGTYDSQAEGLYHSECSIVINVCSILRKKAAMVARATYWLSYVDFPSLRPTSLLLLKQTTKTTFVSRIAILSPVRNWTYCKIQSDSWGVLLSWRSSGLYSGRNIFSAFGFYSSISTSTGTLIQCFILSHTTLPLRE